MKKRTVVTTEKHEIWVIRQTNDKDTTDEEQEGSEPTTIAHSDDPLKKLPVIPADKPGTKE